MGDRPSKILEGEAESFAGIEDESIPLEPKTLGSHPSKTLLSEAELFTDIGRKGIEPPEMSEGVLIKTRNGEFYFEEDPVLFAESASMAGGFLPDEYGDYDSSAIRGFLSVADIDIDEVYIGAKDGSADAEKTHMIVEDRFVGNVEPQTALLYGFNSEAQLSIDDKLLMGASEVNNEYPNLTAWNGLESDERNWVNLEDSGAENDYGLTEWNEAETGVGQKSQQNLETSNTFKLDGGSNAKINSYGTKSLRLGSETEHVPGYEVQVGSSEAFVSEDPLSKQLSSKAHRRFKGADTEIKQKDNTSLPAFLIEQFDLDVTPVVELSKAKFSYGDVEAEVDELRAPVGLHLRNSEGEAVSIPFSDRTNEGTGWPYSGRASQFLTWFDSDAEVRLRDDYTLDPGLENLLQDREASMYMKEDGDLGRVEADISTAYERRTLEDDFDGMYR